MGKEIKRVKTNKTVPSRKDGHCLDGVFGFFFSVVFQTGFVLVIFMVAVIDNCR